MNLREARQKRNKTLGEVAQAIGTDVGNLSRIERGQMPDRDLAVRIVNFYDGDISFDVFFQLRPTDDSTVSDAQEAA